MDEKESTLALANLVQCCFCLDLIALFECNVLLSCDVGSFRDTATVCNGFYTRLYYCTVSLDTAMGEAIVGDKIKQKLFCCWPSFLAPQDMGYEHVFRIVIMEFSDSYNFDAINIK